jgi:hypothetical protein
MGSVEGLVGVAVPFDLYGSTLSTRANSTSVSPTLRYYRIMLELNPILDEDLADLTVLVTRAWQLAVISRQPPCTVRGRIDGLYHTPIPQAGISGVVSPPKAKVQDSPPLESSYPHNKQKG